jgi:hypothetical protein
MIYNPLQRGPRDWATKKGFKRSESTSRVKNGKKISANPKVAKVAGDGLYGFKTRRQKDEVAITTGQDGEYIRVNRYAKRIRRKLHKLLTRREVIEANREDKPKPQRKRNRGAMYGRRRKAQK